MFDKMNDISRLVLDSISAHVAILDEAGVILDANRAWVDFEKENTSAEMPGVGEKAILTSIGMNYLKVCDAATGTGAEYAKVAASGIRNVIGGRLLEFVFEYPCHSPTRKRWFNMRVTRLASQGPPRLVVSHENITNVKLAEEKILENERELQEKTERLTEMNAALKAILRQRDEDRKQLEDNVVSQVKNLVFPYIERLEERRVDSETRTLIQAVRLNLDEITSPFAQKLTSKLINLTPAEIQVADLVRQGRTSLEIADLLMISKRTVSFHRENLRKKLGLHKGKTNLRTYLLTLSSQ